MARLPETIADLGMADDEDLSVPGQVPPDDIIEQMAKVREEQARSLQEHMQYRQGLEQKQQEVQLRGGDLDVSERLMRVLDTTLPKPFREFEFRGLSRHLGIDPKGDNYKELSKVILGLDPDSSAAVREAFTARIADAPPGQISEFARGILQGKVPVSELAGMVRENQRAGMQTTSQQDKVEGLFARTERSKAEFTPNDAKRYNEAQVGPAGAQAGMAAGNLDLTPNQTPVDTANQSATAEQNLSEIVVEGPPPVDNRVVDPSVATALGYDASVPSAEILARHPGIGGLKLEDQQKEARGEKGWAVVRTYSKDAIDLVEKAKGIVTAEPRAVTWASVTTRNIDVEGFNTAKYITKFNDVLEGIGRTLLRKDIADGMFENGPQLSRETQGDTIRAIASRNAELMNTILSLAYASAKAKDPAGRLSDQDIAIELRNLGWGSGSADLLKASLDNHASIIIDRYNTRIKTETGGSPVDLRAEAPAKIIRTSANSADPNASAAPTDPVTGSRSALQLEQPAPTQVAPAQTPAQETPAQPTPTQQAQNRRSKEVTKDDDEAVQQAQRRFNLEQAPKEAALRLEAAQRDVERLELAKQAAKEARDWKEYQKLKDQQREAQRQRDKISAAFASFAKALGRVGGGSIGGSPSMGADQDASAFKIAPGAGSRRAPPTPGQAKSGYTYTRRRREMEQ